MATSVTTRISATGNRKEQQSYQYTCNTCQVAFKGSELQRTHMQSDWHRYNLKRRVASLPPLTSEIFAEKVLANQASAAATAARASFEKICTVCQRTYFSENAYENHLKSQKHKTRLAQLSEEQQEDIAAEADVMSLKSSAFSLGEPLVSGKATDDEVEDPVAEAEFAKVVDGIKEATLDEDDDPVGWRPSRPRHSADPMTQTDSLRSTSSTPSPTETPSSNTRPSEPTKICLFCDRTAADIEDNVAHMSKTHGLFIPEQEYLVDRPGLLAYLQERVRVLHECLYCGREKRTTKGAQTHMRDKGHCMIAYEKEEDMVEVGQFYDFSSTYSDNEDMDDDGDSDVSTKQGGVKLGTNRNATYTVEGEEGVDMDDDDEDDEWESDSEDLDEHKVVTEPERVVRPDPTRPRRQAYQMDHELHLPSGRVAGHRSLAVYYRQNLHNYPTSEELREQQLLESSNANGEENAEEHPSRSREGRRELAIGRADGGLGLADATPTAKKEAMKREIRARNDEQRNVRVMRKMQNNFMDFRNAIRQ